MDHFACDELCANIDDGPVSMSAQRIEESNQECAKLRAENDSLRQSYLNVQASLNSLQNRYKETKNALIRQLDINRQKDDAFYEMEKRLSQRETSKIREPSRDDSSVIQSVIAEIPFEKKNEQGIKIDYLQKEVSSLCHITIIHAFYRISLSHSIIALRLKYGKQNIMR
jgi:septal ring factor EnvC (AmiA/AmiB activator)